MITTELRELPALNIKDIGNKEHREAAVDQVRRETGGSARKKQSSTPMSVVATTSCRGILRSYSSWRGLPLYARLALPSGQNHGRHRAPADGNANLTEEGLLRTLLLSPRACWLLLLLNRLFLDSSRRDVPFELSTQSRIYVMRVYPHGWCLCHCVT